MRIIAKKKDYYDCIQSSDEDRSLIYIRNPEEVKLKKWPFPYVNQHSKVTVDDYVVGFCDIVYLVLHLSYSGESKFCFNLQDVDEFFEKSKKLKKRDVDTYKTGKVHPAYRSWGWGYWSSFNRSSVEKLFAKFNEKKGSYPKYFEKAPLFIAYYNDKIVYNAILKEVEFFRVFDPYRAYQELSMYLGAKATPQKPIPEWDDETKINAHGFDKYSFRKDKAQ